MALDVLKKRRVFYGGLPNEETKAVEPNNLDNTNNNGNNNSPRSPKSPKSPRSPKKAKMSKKNKLDRQIKKLLAGTTIAVLRSKTYANGQQVISGSKPCKHCCMFMKQFGIKAVYYSNDEGQMVREKVSEIKSTHVSLARRAAL